MQQLKISKEIKNLEINKIKEHLFYYKYYTKNIRSILKNSNEEELDLESLATYNSFVGEVYENIIYEFLLDYALHNDYITKFVLKGPHQNRVDKFYKTGLMIDRSLQIVYKSNFKDISEFDALFFTKDSLYFVEMSTSKKTASLNKRLDKKYALLKVLFPSLHIKALIVLTEGSTGLRRFPSYCTIWITKDLTNKDLLNKVIYSHKRKNFETPYTQKKFIEAYTIRHKRFIYFQTLDWIFKNANKKVEGITNLEFFKSSKVSLYFDIYTKLYIGFLKAEEFLTLVPSYDSQIENVFVSIEKINSKEFDLVYYVKNVNGKLRRVRITREISIKDKELDGFTNAEVRFMKYLIEDKYFMGLDEISTLSLKLREF
ncbi:MAG: hypothetical protein ACNI25_04830 [Halarcobacter sp.]